MNFNGYEVIDYEVKKHKLRSAKLAPDGDFYKETGFSTCRGGYFESALYFNKNEEAFMSPNPKTNWVQDAIIKAKKWIENNPNSDLIPTLPE